MLGVKFGSFGRAAIASLSYLFNPVFFFACLLLAKFLSLVPVDKLEKLVLSFPVQASAVWGALGSFRVVVMEINAMVQSRKARTF